MLLRACLEKNRDLSPNRQPIHQRGCLRGSTRPAAQDRNNTVPLNRHSVDNTKVTDHHAIIPTGEAPLGLSTDETTIYQMVVNRFVEAFPPIQRKSVCRYGLRTVPTPLLGKRVARFPWDRKPCRSPVLYTIAQNADSRVSASMPRSYKQDIK